MPRPIWKGSISFGLVNIPIGLFTAEGKEKQIDLHLLDREDLAPVGYKKYNKRTGKEVSGEMVRGYEFEDGQYVVLTDEDLMRANARATQTVEIMDFVDARDIHPIFFQKPYFLAPVGRGEKGYALLREALKKTGKAGIAKVVIHTKEYLGVVVPYGKVLVLELIRYADELRDASEVEVPEEDLTKLGVSAKELEMAERLVESMVGEWQPGKYHDTYKDELLSYIRNKIAAGETARIEEAPAAGPPTAEVIDLMSLLKKSLEETEAARARAVKKASGG